jgi:hypothetical protein
MKGKSDAVVQVTVFHQDVMGDAPNDAVAIEIAHRHVSHGDAIALIQADASVVEHAFIEHLVFGLVAVYGDLLDRDALDVGALQQREIGGDLGFAPEVKALTQALIELEPIAS